MAQNARFSKKKGARRPKRSNARKMRSRSAAPSKGLKKQILSVIKSRVESKQAYTSFAPTDFNSGISGAGDIIRIVPAIGLGTGDYQRIGDQICPQKLTIRGIIQMLPQGNGQGDGLRKIAARVMIVTPKTYPNWSVASTNTGWQNYLLKKGGTTGAFTGDISDLYAPVNTDAITCHYNKVHFFNQGSFFLSGAGVTGVVPFEQNNMVKFFTKTFRFGNKVLKYDVNIDGGLTPTNFGHFLVVGYVFTDGTAPDVVSTRIRMQFDSTLDYEDA